jgi:hypothetical protein
MVVVIVVFLAVPGRMPKYEHPGPDVVLLDIVLDVRLLLGSVRNVRLLLSVLLLLRLVLLPPLSLVLLLLEQITPAGHESLLVLLLVDRSSRGVRSVVRPWGNPDGKLYAFIVKAIARTKNTVIVRRPGLRFIKIGHQVESTGSCMN